MRDRRETIIQTAWHRIPNDKDAINIAERLWHWREEYFRFIETDIPPTNNVGERVIRRVVLDRKVTQETRSDWDNRWRERIWSVLATSGQRGINMMSFLHSCIASFLRGLAPPSPLALRQPFLTPPTLKTHERIRLFYL